MRQQSVQKGPSPRGKDGRTRALLLGFGLGGLLLTGYLASRQELRPDALHAGARFSLDWWRYPMERNAFARLDAIDASLNAVAFDPDSSSFWAVGTGGLVLRGDDLGRTWTRVTLKQATGQGTPTPPRTDPPSTGAGLLESLVPSAHAAERPSKDPGRGYQQNAAQDLKGKFDRPTTKKNDADTEQTHRPPRPDPFAPDFAGDLRQVVFLKGGQGWIGGANGLSLITEDGGKTWRHRRANPFTQDPWESPIPYPVEDLLPDTCPALDVQRAHEGDRAWAASGCGLLVTTDRGGTWTQGKLAQPLDAVAFTDDGRLGLAAAGSQLLLLHDDGATWEPVGGSLPPLRHLAISPGGTWVAVHQGTILTGTDTAVERTIALQARTAFTHVVLEGSGGHGTAVTDTGHAWITTNAGRTWYPRSTTQPLHGVRFAPGRQEGWGLSSNGEVVHTKDVGRTWERTGEKAETLLVWPDRVLAVRGSGRVWTSMDGGRQWTSRDVTAAQGITGVEERGLAGMNRLGIRDALVARPPRVTWCVGQRGMILRGMESTPFEAFDRCPTPTSETLVHVHSVDDKKVWALGRHGTLLLTTDGGDRWDRIPVETESTLRSIHLRGRRGILAGDGVLFRTEDGGKTWLPAEHHRLPAPWAWLAAAGFASIALLAMRAPRPEPTDDPSIADMLASDRPLQAGDPDALGFGRIAGGVARFLANESTEPPLTVAVTGDWGSGKSSIMSLVQHELRQYGFRTVWFNVWHHQSEEDLLSALMEGIEGQAIPPVWKPNGLAFRLRLLMRRGWERAVPFALVTVATAAVAAFFLYYKGPWTDATGAIERLLKFELPDTPQQSGSLIALVLGILGPVFAVARGLRTFGPYLSRWTDSTSLGIRRRGEPDHAGFRQRFARVFSDVVAALRPYRLVIFIDDLDRCRPDSAVRSLEMINFLVSSADCYVVVGMEPSWVESAVGIGFKDVAEEMSARQALLPTSGESPQAPEDGRTVRQTFARRYLEKLINIEVPVPRPPAAETADLMPSLEEPAAPTGWGATWRTAVVEPASRWGLLLLIPILLATGWNLGRWAGRSLDLTPIHEEEQTAAAATADTSSAGPSTTSSTSGVFTAVPEADPATFVRGRAATFPFWPDGVLATMLLVLGLARLSLRPRRAEKDSKPFKEALRFWHPLVYVATPTPRALKRFVNRVRYYAMCQRSEPNEVPSAWRDLLVRLHLRRPSEKDPSSGLPDRIPEDALVALGAVHHARADWLGEEGLWSDLGPFVASHLSAQEKMALGYRDEEFADYGSMTEYQARFVAMSQGITVRK